MKRILKWEIAVDDQLHEIGTGPVVRVGYQMRYNSAPNDPIYVWTEEDDTTVGTISSAKVVGTGHEFDDEFNAVGSVVLPEYGLVWHIVRLDEIPIMGGP